MRSVTRNAFALCLLIHALLSGCQDEPVGPVGDTYVLNLSDFHEFEVTYMPDIFCLGEGMLRNMRIVRQEQDTFSVEFQVVQQEYCSTTDTLKVEKVPMRDLSKSERDYVIKSFRRIEIRRPACDEWSPFIQMMARLDAKWWTEECSNDHLSDRSAATVYILVDSLWAATGPLHNRRLQLPAGSAGRSWPDSRVRQLRRYPLAGPEEELGYEAADDASPSRNRGHRTRAASRGSA